VDRIYRTDYVHDAHVRDAAQGTVCHQLFLSAGGNDFDGGDYRGLDEESGVELLLGNQRLSGDNGGSVSGARCSA